MGINRCCRKGLNFGPPPYQGGALPAGRGPLKLSRMGVVTSLHKGCQASYWQVEACARARHLCRSLTHVAAVTARHLQFGQPLLGQGCTDVGFRQPSRVTRCLSLRCIALASLLRNGREDPMELHGLDVPLAELWISKTIC
jgi:hypothetical protein